MRTLLGNVTDHASICDEIKQLTRKSIGPSSVREILSSLNKEDKLAETEKLRYEITKTVLTEVFRTACIPNANANKYMDCIELENFTDKSLGKLYAKCRTELEEGESPTSLRWLPFLSRLLSLIQSKEVFKPDGDGEVVTGEIFVEDQIREFCDLNWSPQSVSGICEMLKVKIIKLYLSLINSQQF